jgi:hypothetical protein
MAAPIIEFKTSLGTTTDPVKQAVIERSPEKHEGLKRTR